VKQAATANPRVVRFPTHLARGWASFTLLGLALATGVKAEMGPPFSRREDPIVLRGADAATFRGAPLRALRMLAVRDGAPVPIPFQIDPCDATGAPLLEWVREREGRPWTANPARAAHPNLEDRDEIVLLARDLGPRLPSDALPDREAVEIEALDPLDGARAYAYLVRRATDAPASDTDYVAYNPETRVVRSRELAYGRTDPKHPAVVNYLAVGDGENLLRGLHTPVRITAVFGAVGINRDENDVETRLRGYTDGSIRVLLRQESRIAGVLLIRGDWVERLLVNYPTRVEIPTRAHVPLRPGVVITRATADLVIELTAAAEGGEIRHAALETPLRIESGAAPFQQDLPESSEHEFTLLGAFGGLFIRYREDARFTQSGIARRFFFQPGAGGDGGASDSAHRFGLQISKIEDLPRGNYEFRIVLCGRRDFRPGEEEEFRRIEAVPLKISVGDVAGGLGAATPQPEFTP